MSDRLALLAATSVYFIFLGGLFNVRLLIIDTARLGAVIEPEATVEGVDCNKGDVRCLQSGVLGADRASVDFLFCALVKLPFCHAFLEVPPPDFFMMPPGVDVRFFFFAALAMI